jgi:serine/threonine protein kinase
METVARLYGHPWSEREYVIALHFYFENRESPRHEFAPYIRQLAALLGRTPASIVMRMENYSSLDPETSLHGLANAGPLCERVFGEWVRRKDHLRSCAELLIRESSAPRTMSLFEPDPVDLPKAFNKYELLDHIGDGGFGSVFSCIEISTGKKYAIKIIKGDNRFDKEVLHRFCREMRVLRSVQSDQVIRIHEDNLGSEEKFPAFVMDLAVCSLAGLFERCRGDGNPERPFLSVTAATEVFRSISGAVATLHKNKVKIIHRDINPNNVLQLENGTWVLADFSLAKFVHSATSETTFVTRTHMGWGTAYYAAPEQYRDFKRTDERTDIYALGILLWELFSEAWPPPDMTKTGLIGALEAIFLKATHRDPSARYQSVLEMQEAFEKAMQFVQSVHD